MASKQLPPLIEGWIKALKDPMTSIWLRDNTARELENVIEQSGDALRHFKLERDKKIDNDVRKKRR